MDSMGGIEVPDILPEIKQIDVSDEEYKNIMNLFQPKRSKREDTFIYRPENYPGPIAIGCKPSKECDEYHKNSKIQINIKSDAVL